jgi:Na+-driven multidrug efflux pump
MATLTLVCQWQPALLVRALVDDPPLVDVGAASLRIMSWNFGGMGLVWTCSGLLRAVGTTWPALASGAGRTLVFALTARWLVAQAQTRIEHFWYASVATITLPAGVSLWLLKGAFRRRLTCGTETDAWPKKAGRTRDRGPGGWTCSPWRRSAMLEGRGTWLHARRGRPMS